MRATLLRLVAAAAVAALLAGTAAAQQYRGYTRSGSFVPGNYGMTRPTGYTASNYGMMRPSGFTPSNFGNPGASVSINAGYNSAATPGTPVPVGAVPTLPGTPFGSYMFPWSVSSFPAMPVPTGGTQATYPGAVPPAVATELATPPPSTAQPPAGEQVTPPNVAAPAPTEGVNATPAAVPPPPVNLGTVLTNPNTTPTVTGTANPFAPGYYNPTAAVSSSALSAVPRGFATVYATPQYQSSFYAPLARVYGYSGR